MRSARIDVRKVSGAISALRSATAITKPAAITLRASASASRVSTRTKYVNADYSNYVNEVFKWK